MISAGMPLRLDLVPINHVRCVRRYPIRHLIKSNWKKLGSGSINLYGIDVAIKEVLPSSSYNIAKYFEREWRLMKESCRPNVVLYLGLSRAPPLDGRIFVVSEYIENAKIIISAYRSPQASHA
ncbi:hypothetical protein EDC04DRAFT_2843072, partial [Pisolithus marmoratus]